MKIFYSSFIIALGISITFAYKSNNAEKTAKVVNSLTFSKISNFNMRNEQRGNLTRRINPKYLLSSEAIIYSSKELEKSVKMDICSFSNKINVFYSQTDPRQLPNSSYIVEINGDFFYLFDFFRNQSTLVKFKAINCKYNSDIHILYEECYEMEDLNISNLISKLKENKKVTFSQFIYNLNNTEEEILFSEKELMTICLLSSISFFLALIFISKTVQFFAFSFLISNLGILLIYVKYSHKFE
ncbi:hypothetical protein P3G55_21825 [Leptospira sp. 96542]|nr:hypothetical protein [Leptospira sp. 96542]